MNYFKFCIILTVLFITSTCLAKIEIRMDVGWDTNGQYYRGMNYSEYGTILNCNSGGEENMV